jgi:hypothetical protein
VKAFQAHQEAVRDIRYEIEGDRERNGEEREREKKERRVRMRYSSLRSHSGFVKYWQSRLSRLTRGCLGMK